MKVLVKKPGAQEGSSSPRKVKIELKNTAAIEFESKGTAPKQRALKGLLPVKRVSTPNGASRPGSAQQTNASEVERKGRIDDETLDIHRGRGGTAAMDSKDAAYNEVNNDKERERYLKILAALSSKGANKSSSSPFPPLLEGALTATKIVKPGKQDEATEEIGGKKMSEIVMDDENKRNEEANDKDDKEDKDVPLQLQEPSVASSDGSIPDEDEGVFAQPSVTVQQQNAGPASLIFIAGDMSQKSQSKAEKNLHPAVQPSAFQAPVLSKPVSIAAPAAIAVAESKRMTPVKEEEEEAAGSPMNDELPSPETNLHLPRSPTLLAKDEVEIKDREREMMRSSTPTFTRGRLLGEEDKVALEGSLKPLSPNPLEAKQSCSSSPDKALGRERVDAHEVPTTLAAEILSLSQAEADVIPEPDLDSLLCVSQESLEVPPPPAEDTIRGSPITVTVTSPSQTVRKSAEKGGNAPKVQGIPVSLEAEGELRARGDSLPGLTADALLVREPPARDKSQSLPPLQPGTLGVDTGPLTDSMSVERNALNSLSISERETGQPDVDSSISPPLELYQPPPTSPIAARGRHMIAGQLQIRSIEEYQWQGQGQGQGMRNRAGTGRLAGDTPTPKTNEDLATPKRQNRPRMHYNDRDHRLEVALEERERFERQRHNEAVERAAKLSTRLYEVARTEPVHPSVPAEDTAAAGSVEPIAKVQGDLSDLAEQIRRFKKLRELHRGSEDNDTSLLEREVRRLEREGTAKQEEEVAVKEQEKRFQRGWLLDARNAAWQDSDSNVHDGLSEAYVGSLKGGGVSEGDTAPPALTQSHSVATSDDPFNPLYHSSAETFAGSLATDSRVEGTRTKAGTQPEVLMLPADLGPGIMRFGQSKESSGQPAGAETGAGAGAASPDSMNLKDSLSLGAIVPSHMILSKTLPPEDLLQGSTISLLDATGRKTDKKGTTKLRMLPQFHGRKLGEKAYGSGGGVGQRVHVHRESIPDKDYKPEQSVMKPVVWTYDPSLGYNNGIQDDTCGPLVMGGVAFAPSTVSGSQIIVGHAENLANYARQVPVRPPEVLGVGGKGLSRQGTESGANPDPLGYSTNSKFSSKHSRL